RSSDLAGEPGLHRRAGARLPRPAAAPARMAGPGRAHGADQLPAAVAGRHPAVPWLRPGPVGHGPRGAVVAGAAGVRGPGGGLALVAAALPLRAGGMAVAFRHLPAVPADAARPGTARVTARSLHFADGNSR